MASSESSDAALLDFLRRSDGTTISEMSEELGVTATAVRQRLTRLMGSGMIEREATSSGRGRPSHRYRLSSKGRRKTGANFGDLAMALWEVVRNVDDKEVRSGLLNRIASRLADFYRPSVGGQTLGEKMASVKELFAERQIPMSVEWTASGPELNVLACPYPDLAEQDRGICAMERMMFTELLGESTKLSHCRLDGEGCCTFEPRQSPETE